MNAILRTIGEQHAVGFALVLARLSPLFLVAPLFSSKMIPARARAVIAVALAVGLTPLALRDRTLPLDVLSLAPLVLKEMLVGFALAFAVGLVLAALQTGASLLDTIVGFSFAAAIDPITGNNSGTLANTYTLIGTLVFVAIGGDRWLIEGIARTYDLVPVDAFPALGPLIGGVGTAFAGIFVAALQVAAPVLLAALVTDAAFGVVSRVVPQLNVFAVGFPAKIAVGLLAVAASLPFAAGWFSDQVQQSVLDALQTLHVTG